MTRTLSILALLDECSMNVLELSQRLEVPISTVSNSIVVLEEADLIRAMKERSFRSLPAEPRGGAPIGDVADGRMPWTTFAGSEIAAR